MRECGISGNRWAGFETPAEQTPLLSRGTSEIETQFETFTSRNTVEENTSVPRATQGEESRLPKFVWLMLKITCVFWQKQLIVRRKCFHCQMNPARCLTKDDNAGGREPKLPSYFDADGQGYEHAEAELEQCATTDGESVKCKMCDSYWWNFEGNVKRYTEKEIGVQRWNHSRSSVLSVFLLVSALVINICDISLYIWFQRANKHSTIHILSYSIYLAELSFYPVMCLYSKVRTSTQGAAPRPSWSTALNARFIIKRMQFIDFRQGLPGGVLLLMCIAWPFVLLFFRTSIYLYLCEGLGGLRPTRVISLLNTLTLMLIWSNAQYIMYLCRLSFQRQLQLTANYIKDNQTDLDFCRQLIWHAARDFNCYRRYVLVYMSLSFPFSTWAATTVLCWQYAQGFKHDDDTCFSIVLLVWFQIVMFPSLSVLSSGGLDVSYMWEYFRIKVFTIRRERNSQYFWRKLCHHIEHVGVDSQRLLKMEDNTSEISSSDDGSASDTERESSRMASRCNQPNRNESGRKSLCMMRRSNGDVGNYGSMHIRTRRAKMSFAIRLVMTTALIYFHRILTAERRCFHCQIDRIKKRMQKRKQNSEKSFTEALRNLVFDNTNQGYETTDKEVLSLSKGEFDISTEADCAVCDSYWWNYYGEVQKYADKDLGLNIVTSYVQSVMSITVTAASILVVVYDLVYYVKSLWGKQHQIIHALSYGTFMVKLLLFPTMSIISKMRSWTQIRSPGLYWSTALNARYIVKRLQFLDIPNRGIPAKCVLFSIYGCCLFMMVYRGWIYWTLCHSFSFHSGVSVFCGGFIMLMWGNFQYLMYIIRVSFQRQVFLVRKCIEKHQHDLDFCRRVLGSAKQDFNCFRKLAAVYMIVFVPTTIWSITTSITSDYYMARDTKHSSKLTYLRNHIAILIWVENFVFLFVSIWAVGGVNAEYIWKNFHLRLVTMSRSQKHSGRFWHKIMKHMKNIEDDYHGINFAIVFSVITFFMALELGDIQVTTFVIQEPFCTNLTDLESL